MLLSVAHLITGKSSPVQIQQHKYRRMTNLSITPSSLLPVNKMRELMTNEMNTNSNQSEWPGDILNVRLFKALKENETLGLQLDHERKQRLGEQRMINQILQSITSSELELEYQGRNKVSLAAVVSKLIKSSCSPLIASNIYVQSLAKKIVTIYSNQIKHLEDKETDQLFGAMDQVSEDCESPRRDSSRHISYSLFGDSNLTSATLDAVQEEEEQGHELPSESSDDSDSFSESIEETSEETYERESESVVISSVHEVHSVLNHIIDRVTALNSEDLSSDVNNEAVASQSEELSDVDHLIKTLAVIAVQTDADPEKADLMAQIQDLKEAVCQQSLKLLLSNEQILHLESCVTRKQADDDLAAYQELVHQQTALLQKVTLELEDAKRKLNAHVLHVPDRHDFLSDEHSDSKLFEEILMNQSDDADSCHSRTSHAVSSLGRHSLDVRSSTPNIESKTVIDTPTVPYSRVTSRTSHHINHCGESALMYSDAEKRFAHRSVLNLKSVQMSVPQKTRTNRQAERKRTTKKASKPFR